SFYYLAGWQPRWFLLCGGILSYYDSREDAWKGCKGSIQMAVCEIQVHPTDNIRMDLAIPGEQYFYLKARTAAERQQWLVALGSAKACITDIRTKKEKEFSDSTEALKIKMSELRLYCDILVQQVNKTKETSTLSSSDSQDKINMGALLKSTCNTFLKTLEECMQIANNTFTSTLVYSTPPGSPHLSVLRPNKVRRSTSTGHISAQRKMELNNNLENGPLKEEPNHHDHSPIENIRILGMEMSESIPMTFQDPETYKDSAGAESSLDNVSSESSGVCDLQDETDTHASLPAVSSTLQQDEGGGMSDEGGGGTEETLPETFFSMMTHRFSDLVYEGEDGIPTEYFLNSCYAIVPVLAMSSRKRATGSRASPGVKVTPSKTGDQPQVTAASVSPERPAAFGLAEPLHLSGVVATTNIPASAYVTKDDLASALAGLEGELAGMIASVTQGGKKRHRSPSPEPGPSGESLEHQDSLSQMGPCDLDPEWAEDLEEVAVKDKEEGEAEESSAEEPISASQSQKLFIQSLAE
ncbi:hypothetical protein AB205_0175550, partial [Aquarana catesbeiana]